MLHLKTFIHDPKKLQIWITRNTENIRFWILFIVSAILLFWLFSDWDFSLLLTVSSITSMFAYLMVAAKIEATRSCRGVSKRMFECYLLVAGARLVSIVPFEGYLPHDRSGDWLYQLIETISLFLVASIVYMCGSRYASSYERENDTFKHVFLIVGTFILALLFHPNLNAFMPVDVSWTFALYLESVTVLPQLLMFQKESKVEPFLTHFLAGQALSRVFSFIFWAASHHELNDHTKPLKSYVGHWVMVMQLIQLVVMGDFIYYYIKCIRKGIPVSMIMQAAETV